MLSPLSEHKARFGGHLLGLIGLLLLYFGSHVYALMLLPLHYDEEVHLTRALEVWHGHPFWDISDGKIINQWAIAAFYPQNAPVFIARITTILVVLPGLAAGYALARRWFGRRAGLLAVVLWLGCPYMFFYDRTAMVDGEVGALSVLAIWAGLRLAYTGKDRDAVLTGLALATAMLFKFTAIPFVVSVGLLVLLLSEIPWRRRLLNLGLVGVTVLICFAVPLLYAAAHTGFVFASSWLAGSGGHGFTLTDNLETLWTQFTAYGSMIWSVLFAIGLAVILVGPLPVPFRLRGKQGRRDVLIIAGACLFPVLSILILVAFANPRHFVVGFPILLTLAGAGLGVLVDRIPPALAESGRLRAGVVALLMLFIAIGIIPFARIAYTDPANLPLPPIDRTLFVTGYSAGYGLREAVLDFPQTVGNIGPAIVASMYPDGCRLANLYDTRGYHMQCVTAPGLEAIQNAVAAQSTPAIVYVLAEPQPIGLNPAWLTTIPDVKVTRVNGYPRPGETPQTASVVLWRIEKLASGS